MTSLRSAICSVMQSHDESPNVLILSLISKINVSMNNHDYFSAIVIDCFAVIVIVSRVSEVLVIATDYIDKIIARYMTTCLVICMIGSAIPTEAMVIIHITVSEHLRLIAQMKYLTVASFYLYMWNTAMKCKIEVDMHVMLYCCIYYKLLCINIQEYMGLKD